MHIYPISFFEDRNFRIDPRLCFVLMPFREPWWDLTQANLSEADLSGIDLSGANLSEVVMLRARLKGAILRDANVEGLTVDAQTYGRFKEVFASARNRTKLIVEK